MSERNSFWDLWECRRIVPEDTHQCAAMKEAESQQAQMEEIDDEDDRFSPLLYGRAITQIDLSRAYWRAHNGEYSTPIWFCPFCGQRLGEISVGDPAACEICGELGTWVILDTEHPDTSPRGGRCREHEPRWVDGDPVTTSA